MRATSRGACGCVGEADKQCSKERGIIEGDMECLLFQVN
jgi:hypothetical protein